MKDLIIRFAADRSGATAVEYGLIVVLIGVALIAGASAFGSGLSGLFQGLANDHFTGD